MVERQAGDRPSAKAPHRLTLLRRPSARSQQRLTLRQLRGLCAHGNSLYLLESPRGIITSTEALKLKVGGSLLARLDL